MTRSTRVQLSRLSLALVAAMAMAPAFAQSLSSGVAGTVTGMDGKPVAGADVTITHVESGTVRHATTDANGRYAAQGLRVGGPYTITVNGTSGTDTESNIFLELNKVATVDAHVGTAADTLETVTVTASRISPVFSPDNKGLGTNISGRALQTTPQGNRSIDDIARLDPRIQITDQNDGSISVAGQPNRYNNISVDGLSQSDPFGLNANGLPYTGSPISPDTIAAYNISTTDFDVGSDTVGANINAVTKSGTNEFHGSLYYALKDASSMVGRLGGDAYDGFDKDEITGVTLGGPIVKDRLFFFAAYEDEKLKGLKGVGTDAVSTGKISLDDVNQAIAIGTALGMQPGSYGSLGVTLEDKRSLAKLDWNITDRQRASLTYQSTEETRPTPYSSRVRDDSVVLSSNWYTVNSKTDNYSLQLFSDWTDNFSTEAKIGYQKFDNTNGAAVDQPEIWLQIPGCGSNPCGTIYMGEDEYRHENSIASKRWTATISGTYYAGDHVIKGGFDYLSNEVADVFGRDLHGVYTFSDTNGDGSVFDEFAAGQYSNFTKTVIPNGLTIDDIAGTWKYTQISPFIQDTWQVNENLSLTYGVRVDIPKADHAPPVAVDPATGKGYWEEHFGFPSNTTLGSKNKVIEPRFSFNYTFNTERPTQLRGGFGLFQSTPPYVWLTNPYMNNGVASLKQYTDRSYNPADPFSPDPYNQPGLQSADVNSGTCVSFANCQIDVLDPDFKLPTVWKVSLAFDHELPWWGLVGSIEWQHLKNKDAIAYLAPNIGTPNGSLPDGRQNYWTNGIALSSQCVDPVTSKKFNCDMNGLATSQNSGSIPELYYRSTLLTNTDEGSSDAVTLSLSKPLDHGFSGNISATYTRATEVNPGKSSQAWSNYNYVARIDPNGLDATRSSYVIPKSIKASLNWEHAFFGDYRTTVSLFYNGHTGLPYSWVFGTDVNGDNISNEDLAYIPLRNDPLVSYGSATQDQINAFQSFIDGDPYLRTHRGQIASRNSTYQPWTNQLDLGLQQEFPGLFKGNKSIVRLDIFNFLNMLNKDWGQVETVGFFGTRRLANVTGVQNGQYVYDLGTATKPTWQNLGIYDTYTNPARVVSRWSMLLTLKYQF